MNAHQGEKTRGLMGPLFLFSLAILAQELLLVRLLAVPLWHHVTYMVVTSALLAFAVAGTLMAVFPSLGGKDAAQGRRRVAVYAALFGITTLGVGQAVARANVDTVNLVSQPAVLLELFGLYLVVGLPLLFGGLAVTAALRHAGPQLHRLYFANLIGSGAGCAAFLLLLEPLTGPGLLVFTGALGAVAGVWARGPKWVSVVGVGLSVLTLLALFFPSVRNAVVPEPRPVPSKEMSRFLADGHVVEHTTWNSLCRIDVTEPPKTNADRTKLIFQDCDALTYLYPVGTPPGGETLVPYIIKPDLKSLLVVGVGGGRELALAVQSKIPRIVGLEINAATCELLTDHYKDFIGGVVTAPGVELINAEGRAWLARSSEKFDYIQMTGVDTYAALNSGAYVASESYLYTADAFDDYFDHLTEGGYFSIIRLFHQPDRETLRLYVMALEALKRRGIQDPGQHAVVVRSGQWGILVVGLSPVPEDRMALIRSQHAAPATGGALVATDLQHDPATDLGTPFSAFAAAIKKGDQESFFSAYPYNIRPITDDQPFFYLYHHWGTLVKRLLGVGGETLDKRGLHKTALGQADPWLANTGQIPTGQLVLLSLLVQSTLVGLLLVLGPLLVFRRRALNVPGRTRTIIYFAALGLGFMLLEIALAQKFALFLGHPTLSLSVVIGGMLVFTGLGSYFSGRFDPSRTLVVACLLAASLALAFLIVFPAITGPLLAAEQGTRIALTLALIAPLAFVMGMPMPSGLRIVSARAPEILPWAWGINGVASVIASVLAIVLAMSLGFTGVMSLAAALYVLAAITRVPR